MHWGDIALRLLRGDFVDRLQLPLTDLIVERVLRVLCNCPTASFLGCSANDRDGRVNVQVLPLEAIPIHGHLKAIDLTNAVPELGSSYKITNVVLPVPLIVIGVNAVSSRRVGNKSLRV